MKQDADERMLLEDVKKSKWYKKKVYSKEELKEQMEKLIVKVNYVE